MAFVPPVIPLQFRINGAEEIQARLERVGGSFQKRLHETLEDLAIMVAAEARARAPIGRGGGEIRPLADMVGYRFTLGRSGIKPGMGDRVIIRGDIGARGQNKAKAYAVEMGHIGRRRYVSAHNRKGGGRGRRIKHYTYRESSVKGSTISKRRFAGYMTAGGIPVSGYFRHFGNRPHPYLGPAGEAMRPEIERTLTIAFPRWLERIIAAGGGTG